MVPMSAQPGDDPRKARRSDRGQRDRRRSSRRGPFEQTARVAAGAIAVGRPEFKLLPRSPRALFVALVFIAAAARADNPSPSAVERMLQPGPEAHALSRRAGRWNVVMTLRPTPDAKPIVSTGIIAERRMMGLFLEEEMKPAPGSRAPVFRRMAYLTHNAVEGRWQYVSLDTRFPAGIMPAWSFEKQSPNRLILQFEPLGFPGFGAVVEGRLTRSNLVITHDRDEHELVQQYWVQADGTGKEWLAVQYEYTRVR